VAKQLVSSKVMSPSLPTTLPITIPYQLKGESPGDYAYGAFTRPNATPKSISAPMHERLTEHSLGADN